MGRVGGVGPHYQVPQLSGPLLLLLLLVKLLLLMLLLLLLAW